MNWAGEARAANAGKNGANAEQNKELEPKFWAWALEMELRALDYLLSEIRNNRDVPNITMFSNHAAIFAEKNGDKEMALKLLKDALARDPDPKTKAELLGLMKDMHSQLDAESEHPVGEQTP